MEENKGKVFYSSVKQKQSTSHILVYGSLLFMGGLLVGGFGFYLLSLLTSYLETITQYLFDFNWDFILSTISVISFGFGSNLFRSLQFESTATMYFILLSIGFFAFTFRVTVELITNWLQEKYYGFFFIAGVVIIYYYLNAEYIREFLQTFWYQLY